MKSTGLRRVKRIDVNLSIKVLLIKRKLLETEEEGSRVGREFQIRGSLEK